jgi:hypothetical protein
MAIRSCAASEGEVEGLTAEDLRAKAAANAIVCAAVRVDRADLAAVLLAFLRNLERHGFKRVLIISGRHDSKSCSCARAIPLTIDSPGMAPRGSARRLKNFGMQRSGSPCEPGARGSLRLDAARRQEGWVASNTRYKN